MTLFQNLALTKIREYTVTLFVAAGGLIFNDGSTNQRGTGKQATEEPVTTELTASHRGNGEDDRIAVEDTNGRNCGNSWILAGRVWLRRAYEGASGSVYGHRWRYPLPGAHERHLPQGSVKGQVRF